MVTLPSGATGLSAVCDYGISRSYSLTIFEATATLAGRAFHWMVGVFIVVLASMKLTECHRLAKPGDPMCGLHIVREGYGHQAIYNFIEEAEAGHRSFIFKGLPVQLRLQ